ncbi:peptide deformylase [Xylanimonas allomyrinae]|uniref:Peptide deformylase n=1 Tax=Xylanimonas allomyrinae TaxID=2509459 RepID=A0A4P6EP11_9MICO|nr:peptide deformylase [Xylanimonas allomyrinae]QAY64462.1 peptide deformylase [Xylanimonas allomyrinae]
MSTPGFAGPVDAGLRAEVADRLAAAGANGTLPIVQSGDPVLRTPAATYTGQLGDLLIPLVAAMRRTMHAAPGVGLAAPQIGVGLALAVAEDAGAAQDPRERAPLAFRVLVNPRYEPLGEEDGGPARHASFFEGCLSIEGWHALVPRHHRVLLTGQDETGAAVEEALTGWPARIIQHETDHLRGELYLDRAVPRSFSSNANLVRLWGGALDPVPVSEALGFEVP